MINKANLDPISLYSVNRLEAMLGHEEQEIPEQEDDETMYKEKLIKVRRGRDGRGWKDEEICGNMWPLEVMSALLARISFKGPTISKLGGEAVQMVPHTVGYLGSAERITLLARSGD